MTPPQNPPPPVEPIAVVIVSRNQREALERCLTALAARPGEIRSVVVDLHSSDGSLAVEEAFPAVQFIKLPKHFGTTKALNLGIRAVASDFVLLLPAPVEIAADHVLQLAATLQVSPETGAVCPLCLSESGEALPQVSDLPAPSQPDPPLRAARPGETVACATGPLMVRAFLLTSLQKIDERYGDYGSQPELCAQVRRNGKRVAVDSAARAVAFPRDESGSLARADRQLGAAAFLGKHHGIVNGLLARIRFVLAALLTFQVGTLRYLLMGQKIDGTQ
ncbi:MAG TPA: hypothetical protein DEQ47_10720 [Solibacterales bacterium]|nr:hypothetical protein [Bryobacterales bacterium]